MMKAFKIRAILLLMCCIVLTACSSNVDDLLRAPQTDEQYSTLQSALDSYLGESAQLKYPNSGDFLTPFLSGDWDGDGTEDAAVLFLSSASANVQLAALVNENGTWQVHCVVEGLSDTVDTVAFANIQDDKKTEIVVGYTTAAGNYLAAYDLGSEEAEVLLAHPYTQYIVEDITENGLDDLVLLTSDENGETHVVLVTDTEDTLTQLQVTGLSAERFSGCASLAAGVGADGGNYLILDGYTGNTGTYLASTILQYNTEMGTMAEASCIGADELYDGSLRYSLQLTSRDIDRDGIVEIPSQKEVSGSLNLTGSHRFSFVRWMDYTAETSEKSFGIWDEEYGYYLKMPQQWEGNILMMEEEDGIVQLYNLAGDVLYLTLKLSSESVVPAGWKYIGSVGPQRVLVKLETLEDEEERVSAAELAAGFKILN